MSRGVFFFLLVSCLLAPLGWAADAKPSANAERQVLGASTDRPLAENPSPEVVRTLATLRDKARGAGKLRVIVALRAAFAPEGHLTANSVLAQRAEIAETRGKVLAKLSADSVAAAKRYDSLPFIALSVGAGDLEALANMPEVTDIREDRLNKPTLSESVPLINADDNWSAGYGGTGWAVAVLDTGVAKSHPFLSGKIAAEACFSTSDSREGATSVCPGGVQQSTAEGSGVNCALSIEGCDHGTHVAGIAAGAGATFSGVAKDAKIIAIQVFTKIEDASFCGSAQPCAGNYDSDTIKALQHVYSLKDSHSIASVNLSLGGGRYYSQAICDAESSSIKAAVDLLRSVGIATVISSGNDGYVDSTSFPGCLSSAIIVGATYDAAGYANSCDGWNGGASSIDEVACFSNSASFLDLLAPGAMINSSTPSGGFETWMGTSMSAPHVTGCWALLKHAKPTATVDQIKQVLINTGAPVTDWRTGTIKKRIDCKAALDSLSGTAGSPNLTINAFSASPASVAIGGSVTLAATVKNTGTENSASTSLRYFLKSGASWNELTTCRDMIDALATGGVSAQSCVIAAPTTVGAYEYRVSVDSVSGETALSDNTSNAATVTVTSTAIPTYTLTVSRSGTGSGVVDGAGINCGTDCSENYASGTVVTLNATPASGSRFVGWSGACTGYGACQVTMTANTGVTAEFAPAPPNLTITSFSASPSTINVGGQFTLAATVKNAGLGNSASTTLRFHHWENGTWVEMANCRASVATLAPGATYDRSCPVSAQLTEGTHYYSAYVDPVSGESSASDNEAANVAVTVTGAAAAIYTLSVSKSGAGAGYVTGNGINCGKDCSESYPSGTSVTLTATPTAGSAFAGWSGACTNVSGTCTVAMTAAQSAIAAFTPAAEMTLRDAIYLYAKPIHSNYGKSIVGYNCDILQLLLDVENGYSDVWIGQGDTDFGYPDRIYDYHSVFSYALYKPDALKYFTLWDNQVGISNFQTGTANFFGYCLSTKTDAFVFMYDASNGTCTYSDGLVIGCN